MTLPSTGPLSASAINVELGLTNSTANTSIHDRSIQASLITTPDAVSEFYGYSNNATLTMTYSHSVTTSTNTKYYFSFSRTNIEPGSVITVYFAWETNFILSETGDSVYFDTSKSALGTSYLVSTFTHSGHQQLTNVLATDSILGMIQINHGEYYHISATWSLDSVYVSTGNRQYIVSGNETVTAVSLPPATLSVNNSTIYYQLNGNICAGYSYTVNVTCSSTFAWTATSGNISVANFSGYATTGGVGSGSFTVHGVTNAYAGFANINITSVAATVPIQVYRTTSCP